MEGRNMVSSPAMAKSTMILTQGITDRKGKGDLELKGDTRVRGRQRTNTEMTGGTGVRKLFNPGSEKPVFNPAIKKTSGLICNHCREMGHSKQQCYEIIGYPDSWNFKKKSRIFF